MADILRVTDAKVGNDAEAMVNELMQLNGVVNKLFEALQRLGQCWEGDAWEAFHKQLGSDAEMMSILISHELDLVRTMKDAQRVYRVEENGTAEIFRSISFD